MKKKIDLKDERANNKEEEEEEEEERKSKSEMVSGKLISCIL